MGAAAPGRSDPEGDPPPCRERAAVRGIPVTGPSRTLLDLGQVLTDDELERALRAAEQLQLTDVVSVVDLLELDQATLEVDCLWRDEQLVVELDGYGYHAGLDAFERDRLRDRLLQLAGFCPIRITWRTLRDDPELPQQPRVMLSAGSEITRRP